MAFRLTVRSFWAASALLLLAIGLPARAEDDTKPMAAVPMSSASLPFPAAFLKPAPENVEDLRSIQNHVKMVIDKVMPSTVGVRIGAAQGSGVIISPDGFVLTAGHVSAEADREAILLLPDGRRVKAKTLGWNKQIDSGMMKITEEGTWPYCEMGNSADLKKGTWCLAIGHPGGFKPGRTPVVRLGRTLESNKEFVRTDCTLVGGDSGGPLFDMQGKVIGIHSRIGQSITGNLHVPVNTYRETWDRLVSSENWGSRFAGRIGPGRANRGPAYLGLDFDNDSEECKVTKVADKSPAAKAGLKEGDVLTRFDGQKIPSYDELVKLLAKKRPGDEVNVEVRRNDRPVKLKLTLEPKPATK